MPVDLSNIGLEGQQAFYTRMATAAQADTMSANAAKDRFDLEQNQRMQDLSDQASQALDDIVHRRQTSESNLLGDVNPDDQSSVLNAMSSFFIRGGAPKMGMDMAKAASDIQNQQSEIEKRNSDMEKARLENIQKGAQIAGQKLGKARNQSEWEQGLKEVEDAGIIEPHLMAQLKQMPYDPDVAAYFYDQAISAAEQSRQDLQKHTQARLDRQQQIANEQRERQLQLTQLRDREKARHDSVMEKNGGRGAGTVPRTSEIAKSAKLVLLNDDTYKGREYDENNFKLATDYIASRAQTLLRGNKALDMNTAVNQALIEAKQSGAFEQFKETSGLFGYKEKHTTEFHSQGLQPETAIPLPPGIKSAAEAKQQLKKGKWYSTTRGPAKWNGSAWEQ